MGDAALWRLMGYRALYVLAVLLVVLLLVLPIGTGGGRLPGPDIIVALTVAWAMRQPDHVPVVILAATLLMADLMLMRPPGLLAAIVVVAVEVIRARQDTWRDLPFLAEWAIAATLLAAVTMIYSICQAVFFVPQPPLGQTLIRLILTVLVYPAVLAAILYVFGVRHAVGRAASSGARA